MNKYIRGIFKAGVNFSTHRRGVGYVVQEMACNLWVKVNGAWVNTRAWVKVAGEWLQANVYAKISGEWRT